MHARGEQRQYRQATEQVRVIRTEYLPPCSNDCNSLVLQFLYDIRRSAAEQQAGGLLLSCLLRLKHYMTSQIVTSSSYVTTATA